MWSLFKNTVVAKRTQLEAEVSTRQLLDARSSASAIAETAAQDMRIVELRMEQLRTNIRATRSEMERRRLMADLEREVAKHTRLQAAHANIATMRDRADAAAFAIQTRAHLAALRDVHHNVQRVMASLPGAQADLLDVGLSVAQADVSAAALAFLHEDGQEMAETEEGEPVRAAASRFT